MTPLIDCLLEHPNAVKDVILFGNHLTNKTGVKLARLVAKSTTLRLLGVSNNNLSMVSFMAMAAALRINTSLEELYMCGNSLLVDHARVTTAFIDALAYNPCRSEGSRWQLTTYCPGEFETLREKARLQARS